MGLADLYERYHHQIQFLMIYIREAHPIDGWWLGNPIFKFVLRLWGSRVVTNIYDPRTLEERRRIAGECERSLKYGIRTYVDEMDDRVNKAYAAWPTRLYLVGIDGRVVYRGGLGPFGFRPVDLADAIEKYLA